MIELSNNKNYSELVAISQNSIRRGSKSFSFASLFLPRSSRQGAWLLYAWCRFVDDQIDEAPGQEDARHRLAKIREQTVRAMTTAEPLEILECENLRFLHLQFGLPLNYPLDLLEGMQMDVDGFQFKNENDLLKYCYCVAGTVGLMMSHVMGVSDEVALDHAVSLGMAMQMTNICRDVGDDLKLGRIYFPQSWMDTAERENFLLGELDGLWTRLVIRLLAQADEHYRNAERGLRYLAVRPALAISIALKVYQAIGRQVLRRKQNAWRTRAWVRPHQKFFYFVWQSLKVLPRFFQRLVVTWKPVQIQNVWSKEW